MSSRPAAALAGVVLLGAALAGCAGDTESYCSALSEQKEELQRLSEEAGEPGEDLMGSSLGVFEELRDEAPDDIVDEWDTFVRAWRGLTEAVDDAGIDVSDFDPENRPDGVGEDEYDAVKQAAGQLRTPRVVEAAAGLEQHALDVCKVDLSTSGLDF